MPSPVGHSLIGLALGCAYALRPGRLREVLQEAWRKRWVLLGAVAMANAPDVDYLPGVLTGDINRYHHFYTHTIGWAMLVAVAAWLAWRSSDRRVGPAALGFVFALLASHLLADWLTDDGRAPYGIMAWWPWSDEFHIASQPVFMRLHKREWSEFLQWHNVRAVGLEIVVTAPLVLAALAWKLVRGSGVEGRGKRNPTTL